MGRLSEPIPGSQETISQCPYHTHTLMTFRVCVERPYDVYKFIGVITKGLLFNPR